MRTEFCKTYWVRIFIAGPIEVAKQILRSECMREGLCVTVEPTLYVFTGGEEQGYVVGFNNYPRFPKSDAEILARATDLGHRLLEGTHQHSFMLQTPEQTVWFSRRPESQA